MGGDDKSTLVPIDGRYEFDIDGKPAGVGDLRISDYFQTMMQLAKKFAEIDVRTDAKQQLEIVTYAVGATREFIESAVPGIGLDAPLTHLWGALLETLDGYKVPLFSLPEAKQGRGFLRKIVESKASATIDVLHGHPLRLSIREASTFVAHVLESNGVDFYRRRQTPPNTQVLEWRKRVRKLRAGDPAREIYHSTIQTTRRQIAAHPDVDIKEAIKRQLEGLLAGSISPAVFNKGSDPA